MAEPLDVDWEAVKADRAKGMDYKTLARKYGTSESCIKMRAIRHGWTQPGKTQAEALLDRVVPKGQTLARIRENVAKKAESSLAKALDQLVAKSVTQAERIMDLSHNAVLTAENPRDLLMAAKSWEVGHNGARKALGLDSPSGQGATAWAGQSAPQAASGIVLDAEEVVDTPNTPASTPEDTSNPEQSNVG